MYNYNYKYKYMIYKVYNYSFIVVKNNKITTTKKT